MTARMASACYHHNITPGAEHVLAALDAGHCKLSADRFAILCRRWVERMIRKKRKKKIKAKSRDHLAACGVVQEGKWQLET